jgi:phosphonate degradation associated HDIG domain protein
MNVDTLNRDNIVDFIADIFARRGAESYLGEAVTMAEHMLQSARLAEMEGAGEALIASALLHDIGHYTNEFPEDALEKGQDNHHEDAGPKVLSAFFPPAVTEPIRLHVAAKRYLCAVDPDYFARLSEASVHTLNLQGGPMSPDEVEAFRDNAYHEDAVRMRIWDDEAKVPGQPTRPFDAYAGLLQRVIDRHLGSRQAV